MIVEQLFQLTNSVSLLNAVAQQVQVMVIVLTQAASGDWEAASLFYSGNLLKSNESTSISDTYIVNHD